MFEALQRLAAGPLPNIHLMLVGDGPDGAHLRDLAAELGLGDHISFFPFTSEPHYVFERVDITVLPSLYKEGLPNVLQESMAMNVPVVSSRLGGVPEVVLDDRTGAMVDPGDSAQLADAVLKLEHLSALAVGPGMGLSGAAKGLLKNAIKTQLPLVLDADALNLLAQEPTLRRAVARRSAPTVITPHPAEAARVLGISTAAVQADRVAAALTLATRLRCEIVLKGAGSVCASPDGRWQINVSGNPGLASAGQGDVLTGITGALIAQGCPADIALRAAVHLHGAAADALVANGIGPIGLTAGEVIDTARLMLNRDVAARARE